MEDREWGYLGRPIWRAVEKRAHRTYQQALGTAPLSLHLSVVDQVRPSPPCPGHAPRPCLGSQFSAVTPAWGVPGSLPELGLWAQACLVNCGTWPGARRYLPTLAPLTHRLQVLMLLPRMSYLHSSGAGQPKEGEGLKPESLELSFVPPLEWVPFLSSKCGEKSWDLLTRRNKTSGAACQGAEAPPVQWALL